MSPETEGESLEELEREADRARARLLTTLDVLDQRRHDVVEVLDVKRQVEKHSTAVASIAGSALLIAGAAIGISVIQARVRRRHKGRARLQAITRLWTNPERAARYEPRSILGVAARKAMIAAASLVAVELAKRAVRAALAEAHLDSEHEAHAPHAPSGPEALPPPVRIDARVARIR